MRSMLLPVLFTLSACSSAAFDVAGEPADTLEGGDDAIADVEQLDGSDARAGDAPLVETGPGEVRDSKPHDDTKPGEDTLTTTTDTGSSADTAPIDTGCPLHDHHDPMNGTSWSSCLASGVPGDGSTYSSSLFDDELAHCDAATPSGCSWGPRSPITCSGETCTARSYVCPALFSGTAWSTWCTTGSTAGWFVGASVAPTPICPTTDVHGTWW